MKVSWIVTALVAGMAVSSQSQAQCPLGSSRVTDITGLASGKTLCANSPDNNESWQEYHSTGGDLIDWKRPGSDGDDTETVGRWTAIDGGGALLNHHYGNKTFSWTVCSRKGDALVTLVGPKTISGAFFLDGQVGCN